jgi:hypothetical protein
MSPLAIVLTNFVPKLAILESAFILSSDPLLEQ